MQKKYYVHKTKYILEDTDETQENRYRYIEEDDVSPLRT